MGGRNTKKKNRQKKKKKTTHSKLHSPLARMLVNDGKDSSEEPAEAGRETKEKKREFLVD